MHAKDRAFVVTGQIIEFYEKIPPLSSELPDFEYPTTRNPTGYIDYGFNNLTIDPVAATTSIATNSGAGVIKENISSITLLCRSRRPGEGCVLVDWWNLTADKPERSYATTTIYANKIKAPIRVSRAFHPGLGLGPSRSAVWICPGYETSSEFDPILAAHDSLVPIDNLSGGEKQTVNEAVMGRIRSPACRRRLGYSDSGERALHLWTNHVDGGKMRWTCLDYLECMGLIALGGSDGSVTVLSMVD